MRRCNWNANISGTDADFCKKQDAETRLDLQLSDPQTFAELKAIHEHPPTDPLLRRQIDILYLAYLPKQADPKLLKQILAEANAVEQTFNVFRPVVGGKRLSDNDVRRVLAKSKDSADAGPRGKRARPLAAKFCQT